MSAIVHVCDPGQPEVVRDFTCNIITLTEGMRYFRDFVHKAIQGRTSPIEISVQCDVAVFEWLLGYCHGQHNKGHVTVDRVLALLIASNFLQMESLVFDCLSFMAEHLVEVALAVTGAQQQQQGGQQHQQHGGRGSDLTALPQELLARLAKMVPERVLERLAELAAREGHARLMPLVHRLYKYKLEGCLRELRTTVARCSVCQGLFSLADRAKLECCGPPQPTGGGGGGCRGAAAAGGAPSNRRSACGSVHIPDATWRLQDYLASLRAQHIGWRGIYWHVWGLAHVLYCHCCMQYIPAADLRRCTFHPQPPVFTGASASSSHQRYMAPCGFYPCCGAAASRGADPRVVAAGGCCAREHRFLPSGHAAGTPLPPGLTPALLDTLRSCAELFTNPAALMVREDQQQQQPCAHAASPTTAATAMVPTGAGAAFAGTAAAAGQHEAAALLGGAAAAGRSAPTAFPSGLEGGSSSSSGFSLGSRAIPPSIQAVLTAAAAAAAASSAHRRKEGLSALGPATAAAAAALGYEVGEQRQQQQQSGIADLGHREGPGPPSPGPGPPQASRLQQRPASADQGYREVCGGEAGLQQQPQQPQVQQLRSGHACGVGEGLSGVTGDPRLDARMLAEAVVRRLTKSSGGGGGGGAGGDAKAASGSDRTTEGEAASAAAAATQAASRPEGGLDGNELCSHAAAQIASLQHKAAHDTTAHAVTRAAPPAAAAAGKAGPLSVVSRPTSEGSAGRALASAATAAAAASPPPHAGKRNTGEQQQHSKAASPRPPGPCSVSGVRQGQPQPLSLPLQQQQESSSSSSPRGAALRPTRPRSARDGVGVGVGVGAGGGAAIAAAAGNSTSTKLDASAVAAAPRSSPRATLAALALLSADKAAAPAAAAAPAVPTTPAVPVPFSREPTDLDSLSEELQALAAMLSMGGTASKTSAAAAAAAMAAIHASTSDLATAAPASKVLRRASSMPPPNGTAARVGASVQQEEEQRQRQQQQQHVQELPRHQQQQQPSQQQVQVRSTAQPGLPEAAPPPGGLAGRREVRPPRPDSHPGASLGARRLHSAVAAAGERDAGGVGGGLERPRDNADSGITLGDAGDRVGYGGLGAACESSSSPRAIAGEQQQQQHTRARANDTAAHAHAATGRWGSENPLHRSVSLVLHHQQQQQQQQQRERSLGVASQQPQQQRMEQGTCGYAAAAAAEDPERTALIEQYKTQRVLSPRPSNVRMIAITDLPAGGGGGGSGSCEGHVGSRTAGSAVAEVGHRSFAAFVPGQHAIGGRGGGGAGAASATRGVMTLSAEGGMRGAVGAGAGAAAAAVAAAGSNLFAAVPDDVDGLLAMAAATTEEGRPQPYGRDRRLRMELLYEDDNYRMDMLVRHLLACRPSTRTAAPRDPRQLRATRSSLGPPTRSNSRGAGGSRPSSATTAAGTGAYPGRQQSRPRSKSVSHLQRLQGIYTSGPAPGVRPAGGGGVGVRGGGSGYERTSAQRPPVGGTGVLAAYDTWDDVVRGSWTRPADVPAGPVAAAGPSVRRSHLRPVSAPRTRRYA
ncbi:hypothetical protein Agub_g10532 [Astrephomene gubernaculifera]|uniref:SANT and BTB domain-containing protein n=1 Tax=Astrephomene gubernaculifera TaxID=47775 RepID=A0AAD3HPS8_9CHLO|nr:hypothetical protein Agub_g10532 [Astrephomene gubernaculifera]